MTTKAKFEPTEAQQAFIDFIRSHKKIGSGTCSVIDEAFTDKELCTTFFRKSIPSATRKAVRYHKDWTEREADVRSM